MTITTHEVDDIAVAEVKGQINFQNTQTLKELFLQLEAANHKRIVVDLKETEYIDGFGLSEAEFEIVRSLGRASWST